jgi:hypothetical protein
MTAWSTWTAAPGSRVVAVSVQVLRRLSAEKCWLAWPPVSAVGSAPTCSRHAAGTCFRPVPLLVRPGTKALDRLPVCRPRSGLAQTGANPRSRTEISLGARAHTTPTDSAITAPVKRYALGPADRPTGDRPPLPALNRNEVEV